MRTTTILILLIIQSIWGTAQSSLNYKGLILQQGDLLFVGAQSENLSGAINRVTQRTNDASFDHVVMIELAGGRPYVLHASSSKGCVREPLDSLVNGTPTDRVYALYRIDSVYREAIPQAIKQAKSMLGKPYNWSYVLNDTSYYCSDFIERAFRHISLFSLEPMTFKNPDTNEFDSFWVSFYKKLGMNIPEGELGSNPNGMAASPNLYYLGSFSTTSAEHK